MRSLMLALSLALLPAMAAQAQDDPDALLAAAQSYIDSPAQQAVIDRLLSAEGIVEQARTARPDLPDQVIETLGTIASEELSMIRDDLEASMVTAAVETFTLEEIVALDTFYRTEAGASVLLKTQTFMQAAMTQVGPQLQQAQRQIMQRASEAMQSQQ